MASRGMTKLRSVEKTGLIILCIAMLAMLGIGTGPALQGCSPQEPVGTFVMVGEKVEIDRALFAEYRSYLSLQNSVMRGPPAWKYWSTLPEFQQQADERDLWTFIVLEHLARATGVVIPSETISEWIRENFRDQDGHYDRKYYMDFLQRVSHIWPTPGDFEKLLGRYLAVDYLVRTYDVLRNPTMQEVYDTWKNRHQRSTVRFVAQKVSDLRSEIDASAFTQEELEEFYARDEVKQPFEVRTKRAFDVVYVKPGQMTDEEFAALRTAAEEQGLVNMGTDADFESRAYQYYYPNQKDYSLLPVRERLRKEWEAEQEKKKEEKEEKEGSDDDGPDDDAGDDEDAGDDDGGDADDGDGDEEAGDDEAADDADDAADDAADEAPEEVEKWEDPTISMSPRELFDAYFKEQAKRDLFTTELMTRLLKDERVDRIGLEALAAKHGLSFFRAETPLDQFEVLEEETVGSQGLRAALNTVGPDNQDAYAESILRIGSGEEQGWGFFQVTEVVGQHFPGLADTMSLTQMRRALRNNLPGLSGGELDEMDARALMVKAFPDADIPEKESFTVEDIVRQQFRQAKAEDLAKKRLTTLREMVLAGQTLDAAAAEKGYTVYDLRGISKETRPRPQIVPAEGQELTAGEKRKNEVRAWKAFLITGRERFPFSNKSNIDRIEQTDAENFVPEVITDKRTDAAFLVYVVSHSLPGPEEMPDSEAASIRNDLRQRRKTPELKRWFAFDEFAARYRLEVPGVTDEEATTP